MINKSPALWIHSMADGPHKIGVCVGGTHTTLARSQVRCVNCCHHGRVDEHFAFQVVTVTLLTKGQHLHKMLAPGDGRFACRDGDVLRLDIVRLVEPGGANDIQDYAREDQQPHQST